MIESSSGGGKDGLEIDEFMGFASPNYTQTPNDFFDDLLKRIDELSELKVTLVALRQTFGFRRDQALLSITFIERMSGLSRSAVKHGIKMAVRRGTLKLARKQTSRSPTVCEVAVTGEGGHSLTLRGSAADRQPVTPRNKDIEKESIKETICARKPRTITDPIMEAKNNDEFDAPSSASALPKNNAQFEMIDALLSVCIDDGGNSARYAKTAVWLVRQGYAPGQVREHHGVDGDWYARDWRGQKGQPPTQKDVRDTIFKALSGKWPRPHRVIQHQPTKIDIIKGVFSVRVGGLRCGSGAVQKGSYNRYCG